MHLEKRFYTEKLSEALVCTEVAENASELLHYF